MDIEDFKRDYRRVAAQITQEFTISPQFGRDKEVYISPRRSHAGIRFKHSLNAGRACVIFPKDWRDAALNFDGLPEGVSRTLFSSETHFCMKVPVLDLGRTPDEQVAAVKVAFDALQALSKLSWQVTG